MAQATGIVMGTRGQVLAAAYASVAARGHVIEHPEQMYVLIR
jgi:hypothetical protein